MLGGGGGSKTNVRVQSLVGLHGCVVCIGLYGVLQRARQLGVL